MGTPHFKRSLPDMAILSSDSPLLHVRHEGLAKHEVNKRRPALVAKNPNICFKLLMALARRG